MSFLSIYRPLGLPNCVHSASRFPSWSKISIRLLPRFPTNNRPCESIANAWPQSSIEAGLLPQELHAFRNLPVLSYLTIRELEGGESWPSATKISPLEAVATADGWERWVSSLP